MIVKGNVYKVLNIYIEGGIEGWWVFDYMVEVNFKLKFFIDLVVNWKDFVDFLNLEKGCFYGCFLGWGCEIILDNLFKVLDLGKIFEVFLIGLGENLKVLIVWVVVVC